MKDYDKIPTDPCLGKTFSGARLLAFTFLFVVAIGGGVTIFIALGDTPYGVQLASAVSYTAFVALYGFARNKSGICPYLFTCPVVVSQYPRLLKRHAVYLAVLIALETAVLAARPHLLVWRTTSTGKNGPPCVIALALSFGVLMVTETVTNRAVLKRAHQGYFENYPDRDDSKKDDALSILGRN
jgi:hypothetical protein